MSDTAMTPRSCVDLLRLLHGHCDGVTEFRTFTPGDSGPPSGRAFIKSEDENSLTFFIGSHLREHAYFGVATRRDGSGGSLENCAQLPAIFVDLDFKLTPEPAARRRLAECPYSPSAIVSSGNGLHVYWVLNEPFDLQNQAERERAAVLLRRLAYFLGADRAAAEPARVLRVPGSSNFKYDPPRQVVVELLEPERRYHASEVDDLLPPEPAEVHGKPFVAPETIGGGARNTTLFSEARCLRAKNLSREAIQAALHAENRVKCEPPLPDDEIERIVDNAWRLPDSAAFTQQSRAGTKQSDSPDPSADGSQDHPPEAPESDLPAFPEQAYLGLADEIASLYAEHLEAPKAFLYIDALTFLGTLLATSLRLDSELREEPRLFTVKVARSGTDRKSSSQDTMEHFFAPLFESREIKICYGAGSAEGLQKIMESSPSTLLVYDELRSFVDKASVQQSVLLPMVATLFHRTKYENATKHSEIKLTDAHLSVVSACTNDTFLTMFTPQFRNIGLLNRLFVVTGRRTTRHPIPKTIPYSLVTALRERVRLLVEQAGRERPAIAFDADARDRWSAWYLDLADSPYATRLDVYGLRFLMLLAATTDTWRITLPLVEAVIALLAYQFAVRRELDPIDAEGVVARMERLILRHLAKGSMYESRLQKKCDVRYNGLWSYEMAKKNVSAQSWLKTKKVGKGRLLWLTDEGQTGAKGYEKG